MNDWQIEPEFKDLFNEWKKSKNPETTSNLLKSIQPILNAAILSYAGQSDQFTKGRAKILALEALENYDPTKSKLKTHLLTRLQRLRRDIGQINSPIHIPERITLDSLRLKKAQEEFIDKYGREPSDIELADASGLSIKRITTLRKLKAPVAESQIMVENDEGQMLGNNVVIKPKSNDALLEFVYHSVSPTDQLIMEHLFGLNGKKKLGKSEIAAKLGVSPATVTNRVKYIQSQLDRKNSLTASLL